MQLQQIEGRLSQTQNTLTRLDPLRQAILSEESSAASDDDAAFASAVQYRQELDDKSNIYPFSRLQQMLMGLAALAGFFMGLLVPIGSGLVITETTKSNVALQESEDLDDYIKDPREQYINKSANRLDRMPVSGENISENRPIHSVRDVVNERIAPVRTKRQDSFFAEPSPILSQFYSADRKIEFDSLPKPPVIPQPENVAIRQPQIEPPPPPVEPAPIIIPEPVVDQESQVQSTPKPLPKEACRPTEPKASDCKETVATPPEQEKPSEVRESIGMWEESIIYVQETDTDWFWPVESKPAVKLSEDQEKSKVLRSEPEVVKSGIRRADDTVRKPGEREVVEEPTVMADSDIAGEPVIMAVQPENITDQPSVPVLYYLDKGDLADQGDLQLYINEDDLRAMQTTSSGGLTSDEPVYFYLYVDEQHLADNPPVEPVEVPESQKKKNTEAAGPQRFTAEVPQLKSEPASMQSDVNGRHLESDPPESPIPSELPDIADTDKKPQMLLQPDDNEPPLEFMEDITGLEFMAFEGLPEVEEYVIEPESTGDIAPPILCYEPSGFKLPELSQKEQESKVFVVSETAVSAVKPAVGKCEKLKNSSIKDKYVSEKAIDSKQEGQKKAPIEPEKMEKTEIKSESSKTAEKPAMSENVTDKVETSRTILPAEHQAMLLATVDLDKDLSTDLRPDSPYARIFKNIDRMRADNPCPIILVSSLKPAELSPRFAVNLGLALVTRKLRVLLIEAEQVSDDLAAVFEMAPNAGFFEWRRGEVWASKAIHETMMPGMSFMASGVPSGDQGGNQIDLGKEMHRWSNLRRNYDMLFLYSRRALSAGPVAPDEPVGLALLDMADGVLGLTRLDKPQSNDKPLDIPGNVECIQTVLARRKGRSLGLVGISS
ncbi:MAG: CpsD/CapB family tyrosine-protein kinase [Planctomycetes bacterium]|nr:CpsD/CapB family tyrosine-protein kinase [Planctomycetota bacterium]